VTTNTSVYSMQVLNKIIQKVELPKEFIDSYIKHSINNYKQDKKEQKLRSARLLAIFIFNLIEHEHIVIDKITPEVI
jgi:uncharacterized protein (UPF0147 family)